MSTDIHEYLEALDPTSREICELLQTAITKGLPETENKVWHGHPVWFIQGNPIVGYSKQKAGVRLMFWSGADFDEPGLSDVGEKFKDASIFYLSADEVNTVDLARWLEKSQRIQWDYKNIVKRKGRLEKL